MIQAGFAADSRNAVGLYKTEDRGTYAGGLILAGFGTFPPPGAICDDAIQKVMEFNAVQLQNSLEHMLEQRCEDMEHAKKLLTSKLNRLNESISFLQRSFGQGIYLCGAICYIAGEHYICLPFGGACAYIWEDNSYHALTNAAAPKDQMHYIYDALGGSKEMPVSFAEGYLREAMHMVLVTQPAPEDLINSMMKALSVADAKLTSYEFHRGLDSRIMPTAVLTISQRGKNPYSGGDTV